MPFVIVCSLVLSSILSWSISGIIYILGLAITCGFTMFVNSRVVPSASALIPNAKCGIISLGENGSTYSNFPLSSVTYAFTFFYIFYFIIGSAKQKTSDGLGNLKKGNLLTVLQYNLPVLILFPVLMALDSFWIVSNNCSPHWLYIVASIMIGCGFGLVWGYIIESMDPSLAIVTSSSGAQVCTRPSKTFYQCRVKR